MTNNPNSLAVEAVLDEMGAELAQVIAKQAKSLAIAKVHIAQLQQQTQPTEGEMNEPA